MASILIAGIIWLQALSVFIPPDLENLQSAARKIYRIQFDEAISDFRQYQKKYPDRPEGYFLESMVIWWKVLLTLPNGGWQEEFRQSINRTISILERKTEEKPELKQVYDLYQAGSYGFLARMHVNNQYWVEAAVAGARAYPVLLRLLETENGFEDSRLGTGIYRYYASWVPEKFPFLKPFLFFLPEADRAKGLADLKIVSGKGYLANVEATYFLLMISQEYEPDAQTAGQLSSKLVTTFPENPLFHLMNAISSEQGGNYQQLKEKMARFNAKAVDNTWFASLQSVKTWYYTGLGFAKTKQPVDAKAALLKGITHHRLKPFGALDDFYFRSLLELGFIEIEQGNKDAAGKYWMEVSESADQKLAGDARRNLKKYGLIND